MFKVRAHKRRKRDIKGQLLPLKKRMSPAQLKRREVRKEGRA